MLYVLLRHTQHLSIVLNESKTVYSAIVIMSTVYINLEDFITLHVNLAAFSERRRTLTKLYTYNYKCTFNFRLFTSPTVGFLYSHFPPAEFPVSL